MIQENQWEYLYNCAYPAFPRLVREFYDHMIVTQDDDIGLIMQTVVRGHTIQIDPQLINTVIGVPVLPVPRVPFPDGVEAPSIDYLLDFFEGRPQGEERVHSHRGVYGPNWAGYICFPQPAPQWMGLKFGIRNPHSEWSTRWTSGSTDGDWFLRVWVFLFFFFSWTQNQVGCELKPLFWVLLLGSSIGLIF